MTETLALCHEWRVEQLAVGPGRQDRDNRDDRRADDEAPDDDAPATAEGPLYRRPAAPPARFPVALSTVVCSLTPESCHVRAG